MPTPRKNRSKDDIPLATDGKPVGAIAAAYTALKQSNKDNDAQIKKLRVPLEKFLEKNHKVDAQGTKVSEVMFQGKKYLLLNVLRESVQEKSDALKIVEKKFPHLKKQLIEEVKILRIDKLEALINSGKLTVAEVKQLTDSVKTYAFQVKPI